MRRLSALDGRRVRATDSRGNTCAGVAEAFAPDRGLREFDREEAGVRIGESVLFESDIERIECLPTYEEAVTSIPPGRYRHFKGNEYEVLAIARHSETGEAMVVYRALYGDFGVWVRPAEMWNETIVRDGRTFRRFEKAD